MADPSDAPFQQLVQRIDPRSRLLRATDLAGGISARVTVLEVAQQDGRTQQLLVRRHGQVDRRHNPRIARDEFRLLQITHSRGLLTPRPCYVDESCDLFPDPVIVIEYVDGTTEFAPSGLDDYLAQMAEQLARIHRIALAEELAFLPQLGRGFGKRPAALDDLMQESRIRTALESAWPLSRQNGSALLHGDYWPGNILWRAGRLVAVIDWEDACTGDPLADVANTRLELLWAFDSDAMDTFTARYRSLTTIDFTSLPYWDLTAALKPCGRLAGWGLDPVTEARMRDRHAGFIASALDALRGAPL
jgi:aminoglycoside phosphotransferase (APT) family kinase protein